MRQDDQTYRVSQNKGITLRKARSFNCFKDQQRSPGRCRLCNSIENDQRYGTLNWRIAELLVYPTIQHTGHSNSRVSRYKSEPKCGLWYIPYHQDDKADNIPQVRDSNCPSWSKHKIRREADEKCIEDSKSWRYRTEFIQPTCRISIQAPQPQQISTRRCVDTTIPEEDIQQQQSPEFPIPEHIEQ